MLIFNYKTKIIKIKMIRTILKVRIKFIKKIIIKYYRSKNKPRETGYIEVNIYRDKYRQQKK